MKTNMDSVFGYPSIIRFSWKTCDKLLDSGTFRVLWKEEPDEEEELWHKSPTKSKNSKSPQCVGGPKKKRGQVKNRFRYFGDNSMELVNDF